MDTFLNKVLKNPSYEGHTIEYYPHIELLYETGGVIRNEDITELKIPYTQIKKSIFTEYVYNEKCLRVYDNKEREYLHAQQICNKIITDVETSTSAIIIMSMYEYIDPNKFPIINKYHDIRKKIVSTYEYKNITIDLITEQPDINNLKISFMVPCNEQLKKKIMIHFKEVVSSMS